MTKLEYIFKFMFCIAMFENLVFLRTRFSCLGKIIHKSCFINMTIFVTNRHNFFPSLHFIAMRANFFQIFINSIPNNANESSLSCRSQSPHWMLSASWCKLANLSWRRRVSNALKTGNPALNCCWREPQTDRPGTMRRLWGGRSVADTWWSSKRNLWWSWKRESPAKRIEEGMVLHSLAFILILT